MDTCGRVVQRLPRHMRTVHPELSTKETFKEDLKELLRTSSDQPTDPKTGLRHRDVSSFVAAQEAFYQDFLRWLVGPPDPKSGLEGVKTKHREILGRVQKCLSCLGWEVKDIPRKAAEAANKTLTGYDLETEVVAKVQDKSASTIQAYIGSVCRLLVFIQSKAGIAAKYFNDPPLNLSNISVLKEDFKVVSSTYEQLKKKEKQTVRLKNTRIPLDVTQRYEKIIGSSLWKKVSGRDWDELTTQEKGVVKSSLMLLLLLLNAQRPSTLMELKGQQIEEAVQKDLHGVQSFTLTVYEHKTVNTHGWAALSLPSVIFDLLKKYHFRYMKRGAEDFVFSRASGEKLESTEISRLVRQGFEAYNLPAMKATDIRKSVATMTYINTPELSRETAESMTHHEATAKSYYRFAANTTQQHRLRMRNMGLPTEVECDISEPAESSVQQQEEASRTTDICSTTRQQHGPTRQNLSLSADPEGEVSESSGEDDTYKPPQTFHRKEETDKRVYLNRNDKRLIHTKLWCSVQEHGCEIKTVRRLLRAKKCVNLFHHFRREYGWDEEQTTTKIYRYLKYKKREWKA